MSSGAAWAILGLTLAALIGGITWLIARRRRRAAEAFDFDEPAYEEAPVHQATYQMVEGPVPAAPAAAAAVATAAVTADPAARPWIDIGLRPISAEDALTVELTVSNSGDAPAHDVRVSTWILNEQSSESEQALIEARADAQTATVDVPSGADESIGSVLPLSHAGTPILVAEARYPLPQGGEGRIAATFEIDVRDEVPEARLHDVIERA